MLSTLFPFSEIQLYPSGSKESPALSSTESKRLTLRQFSFMTRLWGLRAAASSGS